MNQLTKSSSSEEIKMYFNAILKLTKASEEFPVNLDVSISKKGPRRKRFDR